MRQCITEGFFKMSLQDRGTQAPLTSDTASPLASSVKLTILTQFIVLSASSADSIDWLCPTHTFAYAECCMLYGDWDFN